MSTGSPWRTDDPFGPRRRKFDEDTRRDIVTRYVHGGETTVEIAATYGCSASTISRVVRDAGHQIRLSYRRPGPLRRRASR